MQEIGVSRFFGCVSAKPAVGWWCRSPNASNSNNFCNVNTDGSANNNNANNSLGVAPDFAHSLYGAA